MALGGLVGEMRKGRGEEYGGAQGDDEEPEADEDGEDGEEAEATRCHGWREIL